MKEYHILSLSGGKDSTALAFYIRDNLPEIHEKIEYLFADTEKEIPETYDYLNKIEIFLGKPIKRLKPSHSFDHLYQMYNMLPSVNNRWCTVHLKTKTFRHYVYQKVKNDAEAKVFLYIGIRADEAQRVKSSTSGDNYINEVFPFVDNGINKSDVTKILNAAGIGYPDYYKWRKRSGCYFCMFQSKMDWINLYENHPDLFQKAMDYEFNDCEEIKIGRFGWNVDMPLKDIIKPENMAKIKENYAKLQERYRKKLKEKSPEKIIDMYSEDFEIEEEDCEENNCPFCHS